MSNMKQVMVVSVLLMASLLIVGCGGTQATSAPSPLPSTSTPVPPTEPPAPPTATPLPPTSTPAEGETAMQLAQEITWLRSKNPYGHTGILIKAQDRAIYLDPVDLVNQEGLPKADLILVTHDHKDHLSPETIASLATEGTKVVSIEAITRKLEGREVVTLSPGQTVSVEGIEIEGVPAYNGSHSERLGYLGFVFSVDGVRIYCSGDTSLTPEMEALANIDIAVMNVRNPYSLTGKEVVSFAETVKPKIVIPIHWMPDNDTYGDLEEIETIEQNMPESTTFTILDLN